MKEIINLQYAGCQFDIAFHRDALTYMQREGISQEVVFQTVSQAMSLLFNSYSGKRHFLRSQRSDIAVLCTSNYVGKHRFLVEVSFAFRLSAESLSFLYKGQLIAIFYEADALCSCMPRKRENSIPAPSIRKKNPLFEKYPQKPHFPRVVCEASIHIKNDRPPFMMAAWLATVLTHLDQLIDYNENSDIILSDITDLCLYPHRENDGLRLKIIAILGAIHNV